MRARLAAALVRLADRINPGTPATECRRNADVLTHSIRIDMDGAKIHEALLRHKRRGGGRDLGLS